MTDEPRLYRVRLFGKGHPFEGTALTVKCPVRPPDAQQDGVSAMAAFLSSQVAAGRLRRFSVGLANTRKLDKVDPTWRKRLVRFDAAWQQVQERIGQ